MNLSAAKRESLPREFALAAACVIWPHSERRAETVRRAAAQVEDWSRFHRVVARHRIVGLAYHGLMAAQVTLPSRVLDALRTDAQALARRGLVMAAEAIRVHQALAHAGIPVAFLKGTTLAMMAYGSLGIRHSKDIDILVPHDGVLAAAAVIDRLGYRRTRPRPDLDAAKAAQWPVLFKDFSYLHPSSRVELELHWRLADNPTLVPVPPPLSWARVAIGGGLELPTLAVDDLLTYLCVHGAYHAWFRLKWIADVGALLATTPRGAERLVEHAKATGTGRLTAQALMLSRDLLGSPIPSGSDFAEPRLARFLATMSRTAMTRGGAEAEPDSLVLGTTLITISAYFLGGWRQALMQMRTHLVSEKDWQTVRLPQALSFAYPLLRLPLWLWRLAFRRP
jgi:hypothetical protein